MAATDTAAKAGVYAQRLLDNDYAQDRLGEAVESLRAAYKRASKRQVDAATDEKLRGQLRQAALSAAEAASALKTGRRRPKRRRVRRLILVLAVAGGGAAALLKTNDQLRARLFGDPQGTAAP